MAGERLSVPIRVSAPISRAGGVPRVNLGGAERSVFAKPTASRMSVFQNATGEGPRAVRSTVGETFPVFKGALGEKMYGGTQNPNFPNITAPRNTGALQEQLLLREDFPLRGGTFHGGAYAEFGNNFNPRPTEQRNGSPFQQTKNIPRRNFEGKPTDQKYTINGDPQREINLQDVTSESKLGQSEAGMSSPTAEKEIFTSEKLQREIQGLESSQTAVEKTIGAEHDITIEKSAADEVPTDSLIEEIRREADSIGTSNADIHHSAAWKDALNLKNKRKTKKHNFMDALQNGLRKSKEFFAAEGKGEGMSPNKWNKKMEKKISSALKEITAAAQNKVRQFAYIPFGLDLEELWELLRKKKKGFSSS